MSFAIKETLQGNIIEVESSGKLTKEAYERFVPITEAKIKEHGKIRILFIMNDFHGWTASAAWEDIKFDLHHFSDIERLAIVGETKWEEGMAVFCKPFTTARIKYFDHADIDKAREWIRE
ncbi:MAG: STAS/SEC14 domain-containing protein [Planctomycetaceae bacterium]|nr:STAS/SEC14 domain-containing protein [Planctomycetaceae bacterium]